MFAAYAVWKNTPQEVVILLLDQKNSFFCNIGIKLCFVKMIIHENFIEKQNK
jgi:hypothetical protein